MYWLEQRKLLISSLESAFNLILLVSWHIACVYQPASTLSNEPLIHCVSPLGSPLRYGLQNEEWIFNSNTRHMNNRNRDREVHTPYHNPRDGQQTNWFRRPHRPHPMEGPP